jgi:hypothetical protein
MAYDKGDLVRCRATFRDPEDNDAYVDPAVVKFKFKTPAGATTTYTYGTDVQLVKDSTGKYHVDVDANAAGQWSYRFEATGALQAAQEGVFTVNAGAF